MLPTDTDIVNHTQHLKREKMGLGEWRNNTPVSEIAKVVADSVCDVWDKTDIPHFGTQNPKWVREKVEKLLSRAKTVLKIPVERRNNVELEGEWSKLFDISLCPHREKKLCNCPNCNTPHPELCTCTGGTKVPEGWRDFLWDQREKREQYLSTIDRKRLKEERERRQAEERTQRRNWEDRESMDRARRRSDVEVERIFGAAGDSELVDSEGNRLSDCESKTDDVSDSEWEDIVEQSEKNNMVSLRRFSRECDRTKQSNRGAAKTGNALLKDYGIVTKTDQTLLICPNKLKREREKWGKVRVEKRKSGEYPDAYYFDGKKCNTMVRETKQVKVRDQNQHRRGSTTVSTTGTKVEQVEHYTILREPGGKYLTHVTPASSRGADIASEIVSVVRENGGKCTVLGCDGTSVNTGIHTGALRKIQLELGCEAHQFVCLLHLNELFLRHRQSELDGPTSGPQAWSGPIGKQIVEDVWLRPIVKFQKIKGKIPVLPQEVVSDLSRDACLVYKLGLAVQTGVVPPDVAAATIGPPLHARWLTTAARDIRLYMSTARPTMAFKEIICLLVNLYVPNYFNIKQHSHCQNGAKNLFNIIELARELSVGSQQTVERVLQDNSYWAHPENIVIGMLADENEVIRRKAVLYIRAAREKYDNTDHPRQFRRPKINIKAGFYYTMIDWDREQSTEPPLTMGLSDTDILNIIESPLHLPHYPCHTQHVERVVPLVTEAALHKVGYASRHMWIASTLESREICPQFTTKSDDSAME